MVFFSLGLQAPAVRYRRTCSLRVSPDSGQAVRSTVRCSEFTGDKRIFCLPALWGLSSLGNGGVKPRGREAVSSLGNGGVKPRGREAASSPSS